MTTLLISTTIIASIVQWYFWFWHFAKRAKSTFKNITNTHPFVSVVICAHNDGPMLEKNLPLILSQIYSKYEVVVVDHGSTDGTNEILQKIAQQYDNVRLTSVAYETPGKRVALQQGIDLSQGPILLLTDADCQPFSTQWISKMIEPIRAGSDLVLGVAPFRANDSMLNAFSRWENFVSLQLFAAEAIRQRPFMALGRNMAYRKSLAPGQPEVDKNLIGGDDDLFVNKIGKAHITSMILDHRAHMMSPTKQTIESFLHQKRRHVSTSIRYQWTSQAFLFTFAGSTWAHLAGVVLLIINGYWIIGLAMYIVRLIGLIIRVNALSRSQPAFRFGWKLPFVDILYLMYYPFLTLFMLQKPPRSWK